MTSRSVGNALERIAQRFNLTVQYRDERDALVEALSALIEGYGKWATRQSNAGEWLETQAKAKALLAKHGR